MTYLIAAAIYFEGLRLHKEGKIKQLQVIAWVCAIIGGILWAVHQ